MSEARADISMCLVERLRHHADVLNPRLPQGIDHGGPTAERDRFVTANVNRLMRWILRTRLVDHGLTEIMDVYGFVVQVDALRSVNRHHLAHFGEFFYGFGFWDVPFDPRLKDRRRDHENNHPDRHDVNGQHHVDVRERGIRSALYLWHGVSR